MELADIIKDNSSGLCQEPKRGRMVFLKDGNVVLTKDVAEPILDTAADKMSLISDVYATSADTYMLIKGHITAFDGLGVYEKKYLRELRKTFKGLDGAVRHKLVIVTADGNFNVIDDDVMKKYVAVGSQ